MTKELRVTDSQGFTEDEIEGFWETHAMDNADCETCRWLATITDLGSPGGAAPSTEPALNVERLARALCLSRWPSKPGRFDEDPEFWLAEAAGYAAEYARLRDLPAD